MCVPFDQKNKCVRFYNCQSKERLCVLKCFSPIFKSLFVFRAVNSTAVFFKRVINILLQGLNRP